MIADKTMEEIANSVQKENMKAVFTELSSYKQKSANLERQLALLEARLNDQEGLLGTVSDHDADPDFKPVVHNDYMIIKDRYGLFSFRNMDGTNTKSLRVCPETSGWITEFSEHEPD